MDYLRFRRHPVALIAASLLTFLIVSSVVRFALWNVLGLNDFDPYTQKIALAQSQPHVDLLFTGASYVDVGFDPGVFDKEIALRGHPVKAFNLGVGGLGLIEMKELIEQMLGKKCCKYVIFAPAFYLFNIALTNDRLRSIHFMNIENANEESYYMLSTPRIPANNIDRLQYIYNIIALTIRHYSNLGLGFSILISKPSDNWKLHPSWDQQGYTNAQDKVNEKRYFEVYAHFLAFLQRVASSEHPFAEVRSISPAMIDQVVQLGHEIEAAGAIPLVLIPPKFDYWEWDIEFAIKFAARCGTSHLLNYADPTAFPELFDLPVRYDDGHLNGLGAPIWSRLLAARMATSMDQGGPVGPFCAGETVQH